MAVFSFANELLVTVVGGILTALILGVFSWPSSRSQSQSQQGLETSSEPRSSAFGQFMHLLLSVAGGYGLAFFTTRFLFKSGIVERGLPMRMAIFVACVVFVWWVLLLFRGKR